MVTYLSTSLHQSLLWVPLPLALATLDSDDDGDEEQLNLKDLVTGLVIIFVWIAQICPAGEDTINLSTQNSPDLLPKFISKSSYHTNKTTTVMANYCEFFFFF